MDEDDLTTIAYLRHEADCPACGSPIDLGDADPVGEHECPDCGVTFQVTEVR